VDNLGISKAQLLQKIFSQKEENLDIQLSKALEWTTRELGLELGIISQVEKEVYTVKKLYTDSSDVELGQEFDLQSTYCSIAIQKDDVFAITDMGNSEFKDHECYRAFGHESYIGKPFHIEGILYGTIHFSGSQSIPQGFSDADILFINLLSGWVSSTIHRIKIEARLKEEHKLYKLISTNSAELICMHELDGTYTYVSPSTKSLLGYSPRELIGKNPYHFFHPDDLERITSEAHEKAKKGVNYPSIEYRIRKKDGSYIWFDTSTQPVFDEKNNVVALQTISRDVSSRKRFDILFEQSQKMAKVGGWEYDLESGALYWTDEVYRIHELEIGTEVFVEDGLSYYPEGGPREDLQAALSKTIETGEPTDMELPFITAKGNNIWVRAIINPEFDGTKVVKLYGSFQDVTEKKRMEELFKKSQQMANVGGWEYDLESGRLFWTDEVYRIHELEIGSEVFVEDGLSYYPEGETRDKIMEALTRTQKTGEPYDLELPFITAKGNHIWVRAIGYADLLGGKATKLRGTFQNISAKKKYEKQINDQLKQLTELKDTREKLYSIIAHDLKNSIFGITGFVDLLLDDVQNEEELSRADLREKLNLVYLSADHSYKMLDNMLTWVRLQSGMLTINPRSVDIKEAVVHTVDLLQPSADRKGLTLQSDFETDTKITGEANLITTVLRNLINNAIKFSNPGNTVTIRVFGKTKDSISISVCDEGVGMSPLTIENLFNEENRPQKEGTFEERGTGLGLILVKELLTLHNGEIEVTSVLSKGSTFTITVPRNFQ